jgi:signal transduction histidine kinase
VISSSPTDERPVFDAIVRSARRLCSASYSVVFLVEENRLVLAAADGMSSEGIAALEAAYPRPIDRYTTSGRSIVDRGIVHLEDSWLDPDYTHPLRDTIALRSILSVPMFREGIPIGAVSVWRGEVQPFTDKQIALLQTFADQAVIAIENTRLFNETKEALEQQQAAGEILTVISSSVADTKPVFDKILESGHRLFGSDEMDVLVVDHEGQLQIAAYVGKSHDAVAATFPAPVELTPAGQAIRARRVVHWPDVIHGADVPDVVRQVSTVAGYQSMAFAPMLWQGRGIGAIGVARARGPFSPKELAMLQTFADQAVIAIQNAQLFNDTKEALERQTATAEILKVISSSPTETQPVFEAIVDACLRLFQGHDIGINLLDEAGGLYLSAVRSSKAETLKDYFEHAPTRRAGSGVRLRRTAICYPDVEAADVPEEVRNGCRAGDVRAIVYAPLVLEDRGIGSLWVGRATPGPFAEEQIALLKTFADQAVIAIQNVRLFKEIQQRTEALSKSVGQLTALGDVSQAISSTLDLEKVLQTIVARAVQLTGLDGGAIYEYDESQRGFRLRSAENLPEAAVALFRSEPMRLGEGAIGRAGLTREAVQIPDILEESYQSRVRELLIGSGSRALLAVPLLSEDHLLGALAVIRNSPGEFAPEIVGLMKTFATQSAIAIQNARLFREIEEKGRELQIASQHKSQFLASMSHELRTPLNAILGFNEMLLGEVYGEVPADMKEPLEDIQTSGKHLLRLINNVLDLAKIEAGRMELALADYSVQDMVESVRTTLRPLAEAKGLEFLTSVPNDVPLAHGDSGRLTQCLMNLAGNSLKFTKQGHVSISVEPNGETLAFRVADTGIGIPPDKIDSLFTEFKQTDATIASEYGGTGLGLSITKKFIEMHGGRIWVESELGKGSNFIFEIPLRVEAGAAA